MRRIRRIFAIVDGKGGIKSYPLGIFPQKARTDRVESAGPHKRVAEGRRVGPITLPAIRVTPQLRQTPLFSSGSYGQRYKSNDSRKAPTFFRRRFVTRTSGKHTNLIRYSFGFVFLFRVSLTRR
jgi:hypothetical protein